MGIYDVLKDAGGVLKEAGKIEQYRQILEVQEKLLEMQKNIFDLESENKELREKFNVRENLIPEGDSYWIRKESGKDGPFCTCCWDTESTLVRLHTNPNSGRIYCPNCENVVKRGQIQV